MMRIPPAAVLLLSLFGAGLRCGAEPSEVAVVDTDDGRFVVRFFDDAAPEHVRFFKVLSRSGSYDGTLIERVIPGDFFVTGPPGGEDRDAGERASDRARFALRAELNPKHHRRGVVSMARGPSIDSADGQFFVCLRDLPRLDGLFTIFGEVIEGIETVDRIGTVEVDSVGRPATAIQIRHVTIETLPPERGR